MKERVQSASRGSALELGGRWDEDEKDRLDSLVLTVWCCKHVPLGRGEERTATVAVAALAFLSASLFNENNETC